MTDLIPDPCHPSSEFEVYPRTRRRHDDKGRIDPALLTQAGLLDDALDAVLTEARAVVAVGAPIWGAIRPSVLRRPIEKLEARLNLLDQAAAEFARAKR